MKIAELGQALRTPPSGVWRALLMVPTVLLVALAFAGVIAHVRTPHAGWLIGISAIAPYLMLGGPLALIGFAINRSWFGAAVATALTVAAVLTQLPLYVATSGPRDSVKVVAMTANLRMGHGSAAAVVGAVGSHHVDILALEELTLPERQRLDAAGLNRVLPYSVSDPRPGAGGVGLWSRYRLTGRTARAYVNLSLVSAKVTFPGTQRTTQLLALHMPGPWPEPAGSWLANIGRLPSVLHDFGGHGAVLVGGDFNATQDVGQFRHLLVDGYRDAAEQSGAGITRTFPSDRWYPPLIAIDHVLTHDAVARSVDTIEIPGSDHRALVVTVAVPRSS